ncbi:ATP-binding protein [Streptomyces sp. 110]|uniref:ATP-binding protein n=2 Tax=Streptomyces endocoffeicus TaxID=2898945 RepID=A0ABS1PTA3_9ACTN|nr:ATP-binding protein [Streptomyces endocoffeicus]
MALSFVRTPRADGQTVGTVTEPDRVWPGLVRRSSRRELRRWGLSCYSESVALLLTELVTNALCHGYGTDVDVRMHLTGTRLCLEVRNGSLARPVPRKADPLDENGRGLVLVDAIADEWGVSDDGTTTWCSFFLLRGAAEQQGDDRASRLPDSRPASQPTGRTAARA